MKQMLNHLEEAGVIHHDHHRNIIDIQTIINYLHDTLIETFENDNDVILIRTRWHTLPRTHTPPPRRFLYLTETKSWKWEGRGGEKVSLKTHATARGMGKNQGIKIQHKVSRDNKELPEEKCVYVDRFY